MTTHPKHPVLSITDKQAFIVTFVDGGSSHFYVVNKTVWDYLKPHSHLRA